MSKVISLICLLLVIAFIGGCQQPDDENTKNESSDLIENDVAPQEENSESSIGVNDITEEDEEILEVDVNDEEAQITADDNSELNVVKKIEIDDLDSRGKYEVSFILDEPEIESLFYNRIEIHYLGDLDRFLVFDTGDIDIQYFVVYGWEPSFDDVVELIDKDGDGVAEFYLKVKDDFGYDYALVIKKVDGELREVFYGVEYDVVEYIDVDKDGTMELINDHSGGGGYVSAWIGMNLINVLDEDNYVFSYDLTRTYYEILRSKAEEDFNLNATNETFVSLLEACADLGLEEECKNLIESNSGLVDDDFDYISYSKLSSDMVENYFDFVIYRAFYYEMEWSNMEEWER